MECYSKASLPQFIAKSNFRRLFQISFMKFNMLSLENKCTDRAFFCENSYHLKTKKNPAQMFFRVLMRLCKEPFHILLGILKTTFTQTWEKSVKYNEKGYLKSCVLSCYKAHGGIPEICW